jgi:hypothetical protein
MSRWLVLAVPSIALGALGCGSSLQNAARSVRQNVTSVQVGLANAPNLGGSPMAEGRSGGVVANGVTDVIANGDESCGRYAENGVLWNQWPACPKATPAHPAAAVPVSRSGDDVSRGLVQPWVNHFYAGWPCAGATSHAPPVDTSVACVVP